MKNIFALFLLAIVACTVSGFTSSSFIGNRVAAAPKSVSQLSMFFGQPKDDGSPGDYLCKVRIMPTTTT